MITADKSKRSFFKKVAATIGFVAASNYLSKLMVARSNSILAINDKSTNDVNRQKNTWMQKQWVAMTDNDKNQMLDEILGSHHKSRT